jgi:hypoxanthine phosphoribosyltransferase
VERVLLSQKELRERVKELAADITSDYRGKQLLLVGILKGAFVFLADLARELELPVKFDFMAVSSYGASTRSSGVVRILMDLDETPSDRHVLIVEDIVDTGLTLRYLYDQLSGRGARSVRICALLNKSARRQVEVPIHYLGFEIPDEFVVGYGLDYDGRYRQLPHVAVLKPEAYDS